MSVAGDIQVVMIIEADIATTYLIEQILQACRPLGVRYTKAYVEHLKFSDFDRHTIPLFIRCGDPRLPLWIRLLRRARHPYLYYIDDNFWEIQGESSLARYYRLPEIRHALEVAISGAYRVITNSEVLAACVQRFNTNLTVLPPMFDFSIIEGCSPEPTDEIRIGFAGSETRVDDLGIVRPVITDVLKAVPNAVFEFAGVLPHGVEEQERIRFFPYTNTYNDFIRFQAGRNWAIGLAPLRDVLSNRSKTNNKYREYGACRIAGVYSDIPPYTGSIVPDKTGLLCDSSPESWRSAIITLALDPARRENIAMSAERDVRQRHNSAQVASGWRQILDDAADQLRRRPSKLQTAYWSGIVAEEAAQNARILSLQIRDAYSKGGIPMVLSKTAQRLSALVRQSG